MGVLYSVWPTDSEMRDYLRAEGIEYPNAASRYPTLAEIESTLDSIELNIEIKNQGEGKPYFAWIGGAPDNDQGAWTLLHINSLEGKNSPQQISFEKGHPELIIEILIKLSAFCGALVLIADSGDPPLVINPRQNAGKVYENWVA